MRDAALAREHEGQQVVEQQVHAEHEAGGDHEHLHQERRQEGQHAHGVAREEHVVEAEHARDRARGADQRHVRGGEDERVRERCDDPRGQVRKQVAGRAKPALDVVAVDPEEEHVPEQVHEAAVQEHAAEQVAELRGVGAEAVLEREQLVPARLRDELAQLAAAVELTRHHLHVLAEGRVVVVGPLRAEWQVEQHEYRDVRGDQRPCDERGAFRVGRIADGDEHVGPGLRLA